MKNVFFSLITLVALASQADLKAGIYQPHARFCPVLVVQTGNIILTEPTQGCFDQGKYFFVQDPNHSEKFYKYAGRDSHGANLIYPDQYILVSEKAFVQYPNATIYIRSKEELN